MRMERGLLLADGAGRAGDVIAGTGPAATSFVRSLFTASRTAVECRLYWAGARPWQGSHIGTLDALARVAVNRRESTDQFPSSPHSLLFSVSCYAPTRIVDLYYTP